MNISATDRGSTSLVGHCQVNISVVDVNDEKPVFSVSRTVHVKENSPKMADVVTDFTATDRDSDADLHYSILHNKTTAFSENGIAVDIVVNNIQVSTVYLYKDCSQQNKGDNFCSGSHVFYGYTDHSYLY